MLVRLKHDIDKCKNDLEGAKIERNLACAKAKKASEQRIQQARFQHAQDEKQRAYEADTERRRLIAENQRAREAQKQADEERWARQAAERRAKEAKEAAKKAGKKEESDDESSDEED